MSRAPILSLVLATDENGLIGRNGDLPWHVPGELAHFKAVTLGRPVIMGRRTHESIGRLLPGRSNIVVSGNRLWQPVDGAHAVSTLDEAFREGAARLDAHECEREPIRTLFGSCRHAVDETLPELMLIGGAALAEAAMPRIQRFYRTLIEHAFDGDTWLRGYRADEWSLCCERVEQAGGYTVRYQLLERTD